MVWILRVFSILAHLIQLSRSRAIHFWARFRYANPTAIWMFRWWLRSFASRVLKKRFHAPNNLGTVPVMYINLDKRLDRSQAIEGEFDRIGLRSPRRFSAIENENPMLGAARSHLAVLEEFALSSPESLVMVCEDDLTFIGSREELDQVVKEFAGDPRLDVLCLAYMNKNTTKAVEIKEVRATEHLLISNQILTQACYVLKPSAIAPVIGSLRQSVRLLSAGVQWSYAAGDVYWQTLQQGRLFFAYPEKRLARQSAGHSDIWNHYKDLAV